MNDYPPRPEHCPSAIESHIYELETIMMQTNTTRKALHRKLDHLRIFSSSLGCFMGISLIGFLSTVMNSALIIPSFGASCIIGMVTPNSAFAQPRIVIGGHLLSSIIGFLCTLFLGISWWSLSISVGLAAAIMQLTRTIHPPAAADPIFFMLQTSSSWYFLLTIILPGTVILILFFYVFHRLVTKKPYPQYWV